MIGALRFLGNDALPGIACVVLAGAALLAWQYLDLVGSAGRTRVVLVVRSVALSSAAVAVLLIVSRFIAVEGL